MIKFHQDTTLYIVEAFDEKADQVSEDSTETFKAGELVDVEIVSENADYCDLQFGDGAVTFAVPRSSFEIVA
jgi:hypothetical protein